MHSALLIYAKYSNIHTHQDLDKVLLDGDSLYNKTVLTLLTQGMLKSKLLNFDEIPHAVTVLKKHIIVEKSDVISGVCTQQFSTLGLPSLYQSLHTAFQQSSYLLFMIGSVCSAVFKKDEEYYFFDSHSHGQDGMSCPDGKSILACFQNLEDLVAFMYAVYDSMMIDISSQFDMLPVNMTLVSVKPRNESSGKKIIAPGTGNDTCVGNKDKDTHENMDSCKWKSVSYKKQKKTHSVKVKPLNDFTEIDNQHVTLIGKYFNDQMQKTKYKQDEYKKRKLYLQLYKQKQRESVTYKVKEQETKRKSRECEENKAKDKASSLKSKKAARQNLDYKNKERDSKSKSRECEENKAKDKASTLKSKKAARQNLDYKNKERDSKSKSRECEENKAKDKASTLKSNESCKTKFGL